MSELEKLKHDVEAAQAELAKFRDEMESIPAALTSTERKIYSGPADGLEAALAEKAELIARREALEIHIFRTEESIIGLEIKMLEEQLKPFADRESVAIEATTEAETALIEAQKRHDEAVAVLRQIQHDHTSLTRQVEQKQHDFARHRNDHRLTRRATNV